MSFKLIEEDIHSIARGEVIEKCCAKLEEDIVANPESWLWTHRRWKHKRPKNVINETTFDHPVFSIETIRLSNK